MGDKYLDVYKYWDDYRDWIIKDYLKMSDRDAQKYSKIMFVMHDTDFIYNVDRDENRAIDGVYNRQYYLDDMYLNRDLFDDKACSVLEMVAVLSKRMDSEWIGDPGEDNRDKVFIELLTNLFGNTKIRSLSYRKISEILEIWMTKKDNRLSLFPAKCHNVDYENTELWSQMMVYITENYHF